MAANAEAGGGDGIKIVVLHFTGHLPRPLDSNYPGFPDSCLPPQFALVENAHQMLVDGPHILLEQPATTTTKVSAPELVSGATIVWVSSGHSSTNGRWHVESSYGAGLRLSRLSPTERATLRPSDWRAQQGAFIFIENDKRVRAYDGQRNLSMLASSGNTLGFYGPQSFPCAVPQEVRARLSSNAVDGSHQR